MGHDLAAKPKTSNTFNNEIDQKIEAVKFYFSRLVLKS